MKQCLALLVTLFLSGTSALQDFQGPGTIRCSEGDYRQQGCAATFDFPCFDECIHGSSLNRAYGNVFISLTCKCVKAYSCSDSCVFLSHHDDIDGPAVEPAPVVVDDEPEVPVEIVDTEKRTVVKVDYDNVELPTYDDGFSQDGESNDINIEINLSSSAFPVSLLVTTLAGIFLLLTF